MNMPYDRIAEHIAVGPNHNNFIDKEGKQFEEGRGDGTDGGNERDVDIKQVGKHILGTSFNVVKGRRIVARLAEFSEGAKRRGN